MRIHPSFIDLFCCLLVIFMMASLMAADYFSDVQERTLPPIDLSEIGDKGESGMTENDYLSVTVKPSNGGEFFLGDQRISLDELAEHVKKSSPPEVCLRVDDAVTHGTVMKVIKLCREQGVDLVSFAYKPEINFRERRR